VAKATDYGAPDLRADDEVRRVIAANLGRGAHVALGAASAAAPARAAAASASAPVAPVAPGPGAEIASNAALATAR